MSDNNRKNLLARIVTPGGDDPLLMRLVAPEVIRTGVAATGIALVGIGGAPNYVFSIVTGSLPTGLSLDDATGAITGTPTTPGTYAFVAQIQDSTASVYTASFSITVFSRLIRKHKAILNGEVGIPYVFQFKVSGNTGSVTWSLVSGNFPAGLTFDTSTGVLSGTPTADSNGLGGTSYFTVRATDGGSGETLDMPDKIRIYDEIVMPPAPRIVIVYIGRYFEHQIEPTGGTGVYFYSLPQGESLPPGIKFDNKTGLFHGIPTGPGTLAPWPAYISVGDTFGTALYQYLFVVMRDIDGDAPEDGKKYARKDGSWEEVDDSGGGSVDSVGGVGPDSSGDISVTSPDGSIAIGSDSSGALTLQAVGGGGIQTINGAGPDSAGDLQIGGIEVDSFGVRVSRSPTANFSNNGVALSGTLTVEIPRMPYAGTIVGWAIVGDAAGDVDITVSHADYASFPTVSTLFTATCTGAQKAEGSGISHAFSAGDVLRFSATDFANFTRCSISLVIQ